MYEYSCLSRSVRFLAGNPSCTLHCHLGFSDDSECGSGANQPVTDDSPNSCMSMMMTMMMRMVVKKKKKERLSERKREVMYQR